jgi:hypothetical protein
MDLAVIARRFAEGLEFVDRHTSVVSYPRGIATQPPYLPGVPTMHERDVASEFMDWWVKKYPSDFNPTNAYKLEVPYPTLPRASCDFVFSSDGEWEPKPEWAVEVKRIQLVGNNGNNNDYGLAKVLSPFLKDRSLSHDLQRLRQHSFARHHACIGYVFSYSFETHNEASLLHSDKEEQLNNLKKVLHLNDRVDGTLKGEDLVDSANAIFKHLDLVTKDVIVEPFKGLWRHPCGGNGLVFAWEVKTN